MWTYRTWGSWSIPNKEIKSSKKLSPFQLDVPKSHNDDSVSLHRNCLSGHERPRVHSLLSWLTVAGRLHLLWFRGRSLLSQVSVLGTLLRGSNETMHTEVGQVWWPGAKLGDDQHVSSTGWYCWDRSLSLDGRHPINGWSNCRSVVGIDRLTFFF